MTTLLILGADGQVGRELQRVHPVDWSAFYAARAEADLSDPAACARIVDLAEASLVINAAAYTAVDRAEEDEELAHTVNAQAPGAIARACADRGIPFLHISTDYVFNGMGAKPFSPDDPTSPINAYGRTKLAGERAVLAAGGNSLILRTSWVFSAHGNNFVKTMLRLGHERDAISVVDDQIGGPTSARSIARALVTCAEAMLRGQRGGIYHFAGRPDVSWAGFAGDIMRQAGLDCRVDKIATADYPTPARRPANSRMDCSAIERDFGVKCPDWRADLAEVITELNQ